MAIETFPIRSRRFERAKRMQMMQHVVGAIMLITAAVAHLGDPKSHHVVLPILEMAAGATLIGAALMERFRKSHASVGWVEIAGALMTFVEAIAKLEEKHHHLSFRIISFVPPLMLLLFGLFEGRLRRHPYIGVTDRGIELRLRMLFTKRVPWEGLRGYRITPTHIELHHSDDRVTRWKITDIRDPEPAMAWAAGQFEKRGLVSQ